MCQEEKTNGKLAIPLGAATERASMHDLIVQNHDSFYFEGACIFFMFFKFCVSDHSAKIVILSRTPNVEISS